MRDMTQLYGVKVSAVILGMFFVFAGAMHFVIPGPYEHIVPAWLPSAALLVRISGVCEILGGFGVFLPATRRVAGIGLILLLIAVFPANVEMLQQAERAGASFGALCALWLRLPLQAVLIWLVWRTALKRVRTGAARHGSKRTMS